MRVTENNVSNGILEFSQEIISHLQLKDGETVVLEPNSDGSVTIRRKNTITALKGILKKSETPDLHANRAYKFEKSSMIKEEF